MSPPYRVTMKTRLRCLALCAATAMSSSALADGGYFAGSKGARVAGRGGAFVVKADDVMAAALNPAGLARLRGTSVQAGNRFSYHGQSYERQPTLDWGATGGAVPQYVEFDKVENDTPWMLLDPLVGVTTDLGLDDFGFAFLAYAPPGVREQQFPLDGGQRYMLVSRKGDIIDYTLSASWKYQDLFGVGASFQWIYLRNLDVSIVIDGNPYPSRANPVQAQFDILSNISVSDPFTPQLILGTWVAPTPSLQFAVSAQVIPTAWKAEGTLDTEALSIDQDIELKRGQTPANDVTMELPLPLWGRAGVRYVGLDNKRELFDIELDVVYETWSRVKQLTIDSNGLHAELMLETIDIGTINVDKYWNDTVGVHLGGDYVAVPDLLTVRAGTYYETAVADPEYANVDFPTGPHVGAALGGSGFFGDFEVALAYEFRHQLERSVTEGDGKVYQITPAGYCVPPYLASSGCHPAYEGQPSPTVNGGRYNATSHSVSLDLRYRF